MKSKTKGGDDSTVSLQISQEVLAEIDKKAALVKKDRDTYLIDLALADVSFGASTQTEQDGVVVTDNAGYIRWVNPPFCAMSGYTLMELFGKKPGSVLQGSATEQLSVQHLHEAVEEKRECFIHILNYHKEGRPYWVCLLLSPIQDAERELGFVALQRQVPAEALGSDGDKVAAELRERLPNISKAICFNPGQFGLPV